MWLFVSIKSWKKKRQTIDTSTYVHFLNYMQCISLKKGITKNEWHILEERQIFIQNKVKWKWKQGINNKRKFVKKIELESQLNLYEALPLACSSIEASIDRASTTQNSCPCIENPICWNEVLGSWSWWSVCQGNVEVLKKCNIGVSERNTPSFK